MVARPLRVDSADARHNGSTEEVAVVSKFKQEYVFLRFSSSKHKHSNRNMFFCVFQAVSTSKHKASTTQTWEEREAIAKSESRTREGARKKYLFPRALPKVSNAFKTYTHALTDFCFVRRRDIYIRATIWDSRFGYLNEGLNQSGRI